MYTEHIQLPFLLSTISIYIFHTCLFVCLFVCLFTLSNLGYIFIVSIFFSFETAMSARHTEVHRSSQAAPVSFHHCWNQMCASFFCLSFLIFVSGSPHQRPLPRKITEMKFRNLNYIHIYYMHTGSPHATIINWSLGDTFHWFDQRIRTKNMPNTNRPVSKYTSS